MASPDGLRSVGCDERVGCTGPGGGRLRGMTMRTDTPWERIHPPWERIHLTVGTDTGVQKTPIKSGTCKRFSGVKQYLIKVLTKELSKGVKQRRPLSLEAFFFGKATASARSRSQHSFPVRASASPSFGKDIRHSFLDVHGCGAKDTVQKYQTSGKVRQPC